jgi:uncharacterized protein (TIGR03083 family)
MSGITYLERLRSYQRCFEASIAQADPGAPVLSCGDWVVSDLIKHLADIYTWAAHRAGGPRVCLEFGGDLAAHYAAAAAVIADAFDELDPGEPCWTLLDDDVPADTPRIGTREFWHRRQALETLVHLWDLRTAAGLGLEVSEAEWLDCADEVITVMQPRQLRLGRISPPPVRVVLEPNGGPVFVVSGAAEGAAEVTVRGSAEQVALLLWGRAQPEELDVDGDRAGLTAALMGIVP